MFDRLELPFKVTFIYLMNEEVAEDEQLNSPGLGEDLVRHGALHVHWTSF